MSRVLPSEVVAIVDSQRDSTPFIDTAHILVNEELAGKGLTDERLRLIELYLAAHFLTVTEERGGLKSTKTGQGSESYGGKFGTGLNLTRYGQQAMALDTTGTLASNVSSERKAYFRVLGRVSTYP